MAKPLVRAEGLYQNGSRWWVRTLKGPISGSTVSRSTGTTDLALANKIVAMLGSLADNRLQWDLLESAVDGELSLLELYNNHAAGTLGALRARRASAAVDDPNLEPFVERWHKEHLLARVKAGQLGATSADDYLRQVRAFIPADEVSPRRDFTEDVIKSKLLELTNDRSDEPLTPSTQRRYLVALQLFYKYARKRVPLVVNPFEERDWMPANGSPRSIYWDWETASTVLDRMAGEPKLFMELVFGSGIELGAGLGMTVRDVLGTGGEHVVRAPGSKNEHREGRLIFVTGRAWNKLVLHADKRPMNEPLWAFNAANRGREIRDAFYQAQVEAKLIEAPPVSETTGKKLWGQVAPHRIHDARHSYCHIRLLGLDGEKREDLKYCASQLGHADEQMVMQVYAKANIAQRLKLLELREARQAGRDAAASETKS